MEQQEPLDSEYAQAAPPESNPIGWMILAFVAPLIGLIVYFVKKEKDPVGASKIGKAALAGFIIFGVIRVLLAVAGA